jgi:hypothetical protein
LKRERSTRLPTEETGTILGTFAFIGTARAASEPFESSIEVANARRQLDLTGGEIGPNPVDSMDIETSMARQATHVIGVERPSLRQNGDEIAHWEIEPAGSECDFFPCGETRRAVAR